MEAWYFLREWERFLFVCTPSLSNSMLKIDPHGRIFLSRKLETVLRCKIKFHAFPFDKQYCPLDITSYGHDTDLLSIVRKYDNPLAFHGEFFEPARFSLEATGVSSPNFCPLDNFLGLEQPFIWEETVDSIFCRYGVYHLTIFSLEFVSETNNPQERIQQGPLDPVM